jgi:hypothetical protein
MNWIYNTPLTLMTFPVAIVADENSSPMPIIPLWPRVYGVWCNHSQSENFLCLKQTKPHKQPHLSLHFYRVCALCVIWAHNLLKLVNSAIHSTPKQFILQIKLHCHQQHATLHDASRTHVTHIYLCHGHQNSSSSHTQLSPLHRDYILNTNTGYKNVKRNKN